MASVKKIKTRKLHKFENKESFDKLETEVQNKEEGLVNKVRKRKVRMSLTKAEEREINEATSRADLLFVVGLFLILIVCFVLGILLGRLLYGIAINGRL